MLFPLLRPLHKSAQPRDLRPSDLRSAGIVLACVPLLALFGWLMTQRLSQCPKGYDCDFVEEWTSSRNFWTGRPVYLPLAESVPLYFGPQAHVQVPVNGHPPTSVLVAIPFGLLDFRTAWQAWNVLSLAALAGSLWLLMRPKGLGYAAWVAIPVAVLLLASNPLAQQVIEGQLNLLLLAMLVGAWAAEREDRPIVAGLLIGAATAIKLYPGLLIVYFLARRRWSAVGAAAGMVAALALTAGACFGPDVFAIYIRDVIPAFAHYGDNLANASLAGLWSKLFVGVAGYTDPLWHWPLVARLATLFSGLGIAALCGWKAWQARNRAERDLAFAACVIGSLLASPITWGHGFVLLVMPLLIVWRHCRGQTRKRLILAGVIAVLWLIRPNWIWNALVPGFEALTLGVAPAGFRIAPVYTLLAFAYATYGLIALFDLTLAARPTNESLKSHPQAMTSLPAVAPDARAFGLGLSEVVPSQSA